MKAKKINLKLGIIAVGCGADRSTRMWISEDGTDFIEAEAPPIEQAWPEEVGILFFDGRAVAVFPDSDGHDLTMWYSEDGRNWREVDLSEPLLAGKPKTAQGTLLDMAQRDSVLVAVGAFRSSVGFVLRYEADSSDSSAP